ncbi:PaaI family thioesterase [Halomonas campisalis]|uniref:PaaI family thioesterase n=1 Tax=Billgrantia campisalis TaxID=74661 RepID=A0ABS9P5B3_9GAMM|nr:PaaI family thioesterase [Halomonas campisalis]MCG6656965.1 PaaI family thioesterase [Halomonas campisalis]MDR5862153.1 PaaI family thioesterase [Halomonas campisalis]
MSDSLPLSWRMVGFQELLGVRVVDWEPDRVTLALRVEPHHLNRSGIVHGGVLCTLLDVATSFAGLYCEAPDQLRKAMTLSLSTTFVAPAKGATLRAVGRLEGGGRSTYMASGKVFDSEGSLVAMGEGTFRRRRGSEAKEGEDQ